MAWPAHTQLLETPPKRLTRAMLLQHESVSSFPSRGGSASFVWHSTDAVVALVGEAREAARQAIPTPRSPAGALPDGAGTRVASRTADPVDADARLDHPLRARADRSAHADAECRPDDADPAQTLGTG